MFFQCSWAIERPQRVQALRHVTVLHSTHRHDITTPTAQKLGKCCSVIDVSTCKSVLLAFCNTRGFSRTLPSPVGNPSYHRWGGPLQVLLSAKGKLWNGEGGRRYATLRHNPVLGKRGSDSNACKSQQLVSNLILSDPSYLI
jgi:hypothetical protein